MARGRGRPDTLLKVDDDDGVPRPSLGVVGCQDTHRFGFEGAALGSRLGGHTLIADRREEGRNPDHPVVALGETFGRSEEGEDRIEIMSTPSVPHEGGAA